MVKMLSKKWIIMCLMKVQRVEYLNRVLRKLIMLILMELKIFCQIFLNEILKVGFGMVGENLIFRSQERIEIFLKYFTENEFMTINQELGNIISSQVGASNFKFNIQNRVVMGYTYFLEK
jgi:hypothetical protein